MPRKQTKYKVFDRWEEEGLVSTRDIYDQFRRAGIPNTVWRVSDWVRNGFLEESPQSAARRAKGIVGGNMYLTHRQYRKAWYMAILIQETFLTPRAASQIADKILDVPPNPQGIIWIEAKNMLLGVKGIKALSCES